MPSRDTKALSVRELMDFGELLGFKKIYGQMTIGVQDMERAVGWYGEKLGLSSESHGSNPSEVYLGYESGDGDVIRMITLVQIPEGQLNRCADQHAVLFTKKLEKVHAELVSMGVVISSIQSDSGGNRFFRFRDVDGNSIEVCVEP